MAAYVVAPKKGYFFYLLSFFLFFFSPLPSANTQIVPVINSANSATCMAKLHQTTRFKPALPERNRECSTK